MTLKEIDKDSEGKLKFYEIDLKNRYLSHVDHYTHNLF